MPIRSNKPTKEKKKVTVYIDTAVIKVVDSILPKHWSRPDFIAEMVNESLPNHVAAVKR